MWAWLLKMKAMTAAFGITGQAVIQDVIKAMNVSGNGTLLTVP
ncbi:hypothetical protein SDC9_162293 [bioreactor metagenome]|uniref:Uncharacterized protein n=1 Tax=bioreactor metagenome TaxID=1076179 RepID=A0A645FS03_9ZZZZ